MANLSKSKALFGFTSPRTIEKIIPEIRILTDHFKGEQWSGNQDLQERFFQTLYDSEHYEGETFPSDPALAARDRITRAPKALGFVDLTPKINKTWVSNEPNKRSCKRQRNFADLACQTNGKELQHD